MPRRDRLPDILLDFDFYTKPRNVAFLHRHGAKGIVALQSIWLMLSQEKDWSLPEECLGYYQVCGALLAKEPFSQNEWDNFLKDAVRVGLLEARKCSGQTVYFNSRIASNGEKFVNKRENYREAKRKRDEERRTKESNKSKVLPQTVAELCQDSGTIITEHGTRNTINTESIDSSSYVLPGNVRPSLQAALGAWKKLQWDKYKRSVSQVEVDALLMSWSPRFAELEKAVVHSTANGWKNIREQEDKTTQPANGKGYRPHTAAATVEKNEEYLKERYGQDFVDNMFTTIGIGETGLAVESDGGIGMALLPQRTTK